MPIFLGALDQNRDVDELVSAYWQQYQLSTSDSREDRLRSDQYFWAWQEVDARMDDLAPADAVALLVTLADAAPSDAALGYLGAGPVEDLFAYRAAEVVDEVDEAARTHARFRVALTAAWYEKVPPEIVQRLRRFGEAT